MGDAPAKSRGEVTAILADLNRGDAEAMDRLVPLVYEELRSLAAAYLDRERPDHTLQPTALVNEAWLRLVDQTRVRWESHGHFLAIAATAMRRVLVNHARDRSRKKRGGGANRVTFATDHTPISGDRELDLVGLDEALDRLGQIDARKVRIVEMRFFANLTIEQTAEALGISPATVKRDWELARAWLFRELADA